MPKAPNETGKIFGRWLVLHRIRGKFRRAYWMCKCSCGRKKIVSGGDLRSNKTAGCRKCALYTGNPSHGLSGSPRYDLYHSAYMRAKKHKLPFKIKCTDIPQIPSSCPLLKIPLRRGLGKVCDNSPTLDQIIPGRGYVRGNIWIISFKANTIKSNALLSELELLTANLKIHLTESTNLI